MRRHPLKLVVTERSRGPESLSEHLTREVMALVREQKLQPGDRLPSVKEMAERFQVATPTMREALRLLEMAGTLHIRHGSGIYLQRPEARVMVSNPYARSLDTQTIMNLLQARLLIEPAVAEVAATHASTKELDALDALLTDTEKYLSGQEAADAVLGVANMRFHRGIADSAANSILADVVFSLTEVHIKEQMAVLDLYNNRRRDHEQHRLILEALMRRDPREAKHLMFEHIDEVISVIKGKLKAEQA
jgi:GntR family transcriptional repressor for pyruvate dehydrogenase complex